MAVIVTPNLTTINVADSTAGWSEIGSPPRLVFGTTPNNIQGTNALGFEVFGPDNSLGGGMYNQGSTDLSNTHLYIWVQCIRLDLLAAKASGGIRIRVSSATNGGSNYGEWYVGGNDTYKGGWKCFVIDTGVAFDNTSGTPPALTAIVSIGVIFSMGTDNNAREMYTGMIDVMRYGSGLTITGGTSGAKGTFQQIQDEDSLNANAYGVISKEEGVFFVQGKLIFGDSSGSTTTYFKDTNQVVVFRDAPVVSTFYEIQIVGNATGINSVEFGTEVGTAPNSIGSDGIVFKSADPINSPLAITVVDANAGKVDFLGCTIIGAGLVKFEQTNLRYISGAIVNSGLITIDSGAEPRDTIFSGGVTASKLIAAPIDPEFRDLFIQNSIVGIEISTSGTYAFRNIKFLGNTNDVENNSGGLVTINILEGGDTPSILNTGGGSTTTVSNPITISINVKDNTGVNLINARVLLEASNDAGDFPFEESVTITRSATIATVTHTAHGFVTGDIAVIRGANEQEYNGPKTITVTTTNAYTYTVSGSPVTPATGTMICTGAILNGLTNASGDISTSRTFVLNQPVTGRVRKSTTTPRFKSFPLNSIIDKTNGLLITVQLIIDE